MSCRIHESSRQSHDAIILENDLLRVVVLPALGGRVWELEDLVHDRQWIWHREGTPLVSNTIGDEYDAVWAGGWEELFPNDAAGEFEGRMLPDHGEWWTLSWRVADRQVSAGAARVVLTARSTVIRASLTKEFVITEHDASVTVHYRIVSEETESFHFLFKQHLPLAITPSCQLALPGGRMIPVQPAFGTLLRDAEGHPWPIAKAAGQPPVDLRRVLPRVAAQREFLYVTDIVGNWCGVVDEASQASLRMSFDARQLPHVWLFLSYGGWRDTYTAVLEPCTNLPKDLFEAARSGQAAHLAPGGVFETTARIDLGGVAALPV
jgi:hypothetical protein